MSRYGCVLRLRAGKRAYGVGDSTRIEGAHVIVGDALAASPRVVHMSRCRSFSAVSAKTHVAWTPSQKAILKHNNGMLPMSVYAQVSIGPNALRTTTHNYCGTSPLFEEAVQL